MRKPVRSIRRSTDLRLISPPFVTFVNSLRSPRGCPHRSAEADWLRAFGWSNFGAESASFEKLPRGRHLPLQPSSAMGLQLAALHAFDVTTVR